MTVEQIRNEDGPMAPDATRPLLTVQDLEVTFRAKAGSVYAVQGVSFEVGIGETLAIVGESGSGKSTVGFAVVGRHRAMGGTVRFDQQDVQGLSPKRLRAVRRDLQLIFQDPYTSLNPRMRARDIVAEPLRVHKLCSRAEAMTRADELLLQCGLGKSDGDRYPGSFSGGQRQRIAVARALALRPKLIVADEVVSALDVSVKAQVINLMRELQGAFGLSYLFISHDLAIVRQIAHRTMIMYAGRVMEIGNTESMFNAPLHPYTAALISAAPVPDPVLERTRERIVLAGDVPSVYERHSGCPFASRCPLAMDKCNESPPLTTYADGRQAACWRSDDVPSLGHFAPL
jgi:oligopeptide/dipeptide ABC transporter ATP-binding protein